MPMRVTTWRRLKFSLTSPAVGNTVAFPVSPKPVEKMTAVTNVFGMMKIYKDTQTARNP